MLQDRVALITGGGRGIGRAIALAFARRGADVAVASRSADELEQVAGECRELGGRAIAVPFDVTEPEAWSAAVARVRDELGGLHILVNNAGGGVFKHVVDLSYEEFDKVIRQNLHSVFLGCHEVLPHLIAQGSGRIINVSSMAAHGGGPEYGGYAPAKAAVNRLTEVVARELKAAGAVGVTCNAICPGPVASRLRSSHFPNEDPDSIMQPPQVAEVAVFFASEASAGVSGTYLNVRHY